MKFSILAFLIISCTTLSCSKSKDDKGSGGNALIGKWQLKSYKYTETKMDGSVLDQSNGDFPSDTYFELRSGETAMVKTNGKTVETSWRLVGQGNEQLLYLFPILDDYHIGGYFLMFPMTGYIIQEQSATSLTLYLKESEGNLLNREQILYLKKS